MLRAMITDIPLVKNLDNPECRKFLLKNANSLAQRFADIDNEFVLKELKAARDGECFLSFRLKKLIRLPKFMDTLFRKKLRSDALYICDIQLNFAIIDIH